MEGVLDWWCGCQTGSARAQGATTGAFLACCRRRSFNPLPAHAQGATWAIVPMRVRAAVFQSSPCARAGSNTAAIYADPDCSVSILSLRARREQPADLAITYKRLQFQSSPCARAGSNALKQQAQAMLDAPEFQSSPCARAGSNDGDGGAHLGISSTSFNPLPARAQGATLRHLAIQSLEDVSILSLRARREQRRATA